MEIPHITGTCTECLFEFDLKFGLDCPRCHNEISVFNAYDSAPGIPHVLNEDATEHHSDCDACGIEAEVSWLEGLYKLEDNRV